MTRTPHPLRHMLLLTLLAVAAACGDGTGPSPPNPVGSWIVWSIDGQALPYAPEAFLEITSGSLDIRDDGSYVRGLRGTLYDRPYNETESGNWTQEGTTVFLNPSKEACENTVLIDDAVNPQDDVLKIRADCEEGWEIVYERK